MAEMNILYLIGNGFDISCGLKTSYKDILERYLLTEPQSEQVEFFKNSLNSNFDDWCDFEMQLGKYTENFNIKNIDGFLGIVRNFRNYTVKYLKDEIDKIDYKLLDDMKFNVFKNFIVNPYSDFSAKTRQTVGEYFSNTKFHSPKYNFISFNYTNVLDQCIEIFNLKRVNHKYGRVVVSGLRLENPVHIHGTLRENVIMGVDNEEQIANNELRTYNRLLQSIIKPNVNSALENLSSEKVNSLINKSTVLCVFGMSLGYSDMTWWKKIGKWLKMDKSRHLLIFHKFSYDAIHPEDYIDKINNVKNAFKECAGNITDCDEQIHISFKTDMFNFNLVKTDKINNYCN